MEVGSLEESQSYSGLLNLKDRMGKVKIRDSSQLRKISIILRLSLQFLLKTKLCRSTWLTTFQEREFGVTNIFLLTWKERNKDTSREDLVTKDTTVLQLSAQTKRGEVLTTYSHSMFNLHTIQTTHTTMTMDIPLLEDMKKGLNLPLFLSDIPVSVTQLWLLNYRKPLLRLFEERIMDSALQEKKLIALRQ